MKGFVTVDGLFPLAIFRCIMHGALGCAAFGLIIYPRFNFMLIIPLERGQCIKFSLASTFWEDLSPNNRLISVSRAAISIRLKF